MKIRNIPAQITTVEDRIAGNLNFMQIVLLMIPVFSMLVIYALLMPVMKLVPYKLVLFSVVTMISVLLAIRIKDKVILQWLLILCTYSLRPKYYIFSKNESYLREMDIIVSSVKEKKSVVKVSSNQKRKIIKSGIAIGDLVRLENYLSNPKYSLSIKTQKKGGFHVAFEQKQS